MNVKEKKRKEKKREKKIKKKTKIVEVYVCICFMNVLFIFYDDNIAKIKEEFNILIGSRLRIINLYVSYISNFR